MNNGFIDELRKKYSSYRENLLVDRRFTHSDITNLIKKLKENSSFHISLLGHSIEGREINLIQIGNGKTKILLWSQMHGDEATATSAFFDLFNFFNKRDELDDLRKLLDEKLTLYFVPMLNPDGAEKIIRFNALGIDLNRDAISLQAPESKILNNLVHDIQPQFAFNMHDQDFRWSVGSNSKVAAVSFLAPVYDDDKSTNETRNKAITLISNLTNSFRTLLDGRITRYSDDYEPRSFGDYISAQNISTILIEAGRWKNDTEKQFLREINFLILLHSFFLIANNKIENDDKTYYEIPYNGKFLYDVIFRNVTIVKNDLSFKVDIAINREEKYYGVERTPYYTSIVEAIGDLSTLYGLSEQNCDGYEHKQGRLFEASINSEEMLKSQLLNLINDNYLFVKMENYNQDKPYLNYPINVLISSDSVDNELSIGGKANFILEKAGADKLIVINGFLSCKESILNNAINGLVY